MSIAGLEYGREVSLLPSHIQSLADKSVLLLQQLRLHPSPVWTVQHALRR
jgi:hypothetical protein